MKIHLSSKMKILTVLFGTVFTLALATWWMIFGLGLIEQIGKLSSENLAEDLARQQKMLFWEGGILLFMLLTGGIALVYFVVHEIQTNKKLRTFFATFSHDLKTSLTSLRLQVESIAEDLGDTSSPHLSRLIQDTVRLQLQLENALYLARMESTPFFKQEVELAKVLHSLHYHWPHLHISYSGSHRLLVDAKAIESVLTNIIQNSVHHGKATEMAIKVAKLNSASNSTSASASASNSNSNSASASNSNSNSASGSASGSNSASDSSSNSSFYSLSLKDNGQGFEGQSQNLGKLFYRHNSRSGSGIGLYMVKSLVEKMGGQVNFKLSQKQKHEQQQGEKPEQKQGQGFEVNINLPGV